MTAFDYAVLGVTGASSLLGLWRGVVSEILALVAWVAAFFAARAWGGAAAGFFGAWLADPAIGYAAGFVSVFVAVLIAFAVARLALSLLLRAVGLGLVDRLLGASFGVARGVLIALAGVLVAGFTALPRQAWWREAVLAPPLETAVLAARPFLPREAAQRIKYR